LDFLKKPIFLILIAVAIIAAVIWAYVSNRSAEKVAEEKAVEEQAAVDLQSQPLVADLTNIDDGEIIDSIKSQTEIADSNATGADSRNQLAAVDIQLPKSLAQGSGTTNYIYTSTADRTNNWVISISNSSQAFVRSRVYKNDYLGNLTAISRNFWKLNYVQALQIAEKNGGLSFRNYYDTSSVRLVLKNGDPKGWLYWYVTYTATGQVKSIQIDADSGAIVADDEEGEE
jgi:hypothetical protein